MGCGAPGDGVDDQHHGQVDGNDPEQDGRLEHDVGQLLAASDVRKGEELGDLGGQGRPSSVWATATVCAHVFCTG